MLVVERKTREVGSVGMAIAITEREANAWKKRVAPSRFAPGQVLFYRGHQAYGLYVIHSGSVDLRVSEKDSHVPIRIGPNTILGLATLVGGQPYPLTAVVTEEVRASFVEKNQLLEWLRKRDSLVPPAIRFLKQTERKRSRKSA